MDKDKHRSNADLDLNLLIPGRFVVKNSDMIKHIAKESVDYYKNDHPAKNLYNMLRNIREKKQREKCHIYAAGRELSKPLCGLDKVFFLYSPISP